MLRLDADSFSRPLTPSPLREGGGGAAKRTSVMFSETKVILTPPPLLKGGEGVRGREGTLGRKCYPDLPGLSD